MHTLDLYLLIPIVFGFVFGLFKGLVKELASLAAIVLGIYGAKLFAPAVSGFLVHKFDFSIRTAQPVSYLLVFVVIALGLLMLASMLDKLFDSMALGGLNKFLGGLFGALKYALLVSVFLNLVNALDSHYSFIKEKSRQESFAYKPLLKLGPALWDETKKNKEEAKTNDPSYEERKTRQK